MVIVFCDIVNDKVRKGYDNEVKVELRNEDTECAQYDTSGHM